MAELSVLCTGSFDAEAQGRRMKNLFGDVQWCAGTLSGSGDSPSLNCWIVRSYDAKKLYHLPEIGLVRGAAPSRRATEEIPWENGSVPVHRVYYHESDGDVYVAYILIYNSKPIGNPYIAQILSFPKQLVTGVAPMNLLFVSGRGPRGSLAGMQERGNRWLLESLRYYRSRCGD